MTHTERIKVWDPLVIFFHWSLVSAFTIAFITEDEWLTPHTWAGYFIFTLLLIRIAWGFIGTRYTRFSDFVYRAETIKQFLKESLLFKAKRYIGHNPAGGAMVIALIATLFATTSSGILLLGSEEQMGPVAHWFSNSSGYWSDLLEGIHEFFANFALLLVIIHIAGVAFESIAHKENLVRSMWTGFKRK